MDELFLFLLEGADPRTDRVVMQHSGGRALFVWAPDAASAALVATEAVDAGAKLIELYRGFDLLQAAAVIEAVGERVPVGVGGRAPGPAHDLTSTAMIYHDPNAAPAGDRLVRDHPDGRRTTIVAAPDERATAAIARELAESGTDLIEICGGTPLTTAAAAAAAVDGRAEVTLVSWPFESIDGAHEFKAAYEASVVPS